MKVLKTTVEEYEAFARRVIANLPDSLSARRSELLILIKALPLASQGRSIAREMLHALNIHDRAQAEFTFTKGGIA